MDFLNLLEGESEFLFFAKYYLVRVSKSLESISKWDYEMIISEQGTQLRRYLRQRLAEIKFIINCLPKRALASNRCDKIDSIFHDEFPVASPLLAHRHAPSHSHGENTERCVCLTYFHSTIFHFLCFFGDTA